MAWTRLGVAALLLGALVAVPTPAPAGPAARIEGRLVEIAVDGATGPAYAVQRADGRFVDLPAGTRLPVSDDGARVSADVTTSGEVRLTAVRRLAAAPRVAAGTAHRAYLAQVDNQGAYADSDARIDQYVDAALHRWVVESNRQITSFARVGGIKTFAETGSCPSGSALWNQAVGLFPGVTFGGDTGNHLLVMAPKGCGGGVGTVGSSGLRSGGLLSFAYDPDESAYTLVHELGHNFGLAHARALVCDPSCAEQEYGDDYSPMGYSIVHDPPFVPPALTSFEVARIGALGHCEMPGLALAAGQRSVSATYDLFGRGTTAGTRGLRVVVPGGATAYFLDWRNRSGLDARTYYGSDLALAQSDQFASGVTVATFAAGDDHSVLQSLPRTDGEAGTTFALQAGQAYTHGDVSIRVLTAGATGPSAPPGATAQVRVTVSDPTVTGTPPALPAQSGTVAVRGIAGRGSVLTAAVRSGLSGACLRYQWLDRGRAIPGARSSTLRLPAALDGHRVSVRVTAQRTGYLPLTTTSPAVVVGRFAPGRPKVLGTLRAGRTVRAVIGRWQPAPTGVRYRWVVGGRTVTGDHTARLRLTRTMVGRRVRVVVVGSRPGFDPARASSPTRGPVR